MSPLTNTIVSTFESVCILGSIAGRENICYSFPTRRHALTEDTLLISVLLMQTTVLVSYPHALNPESLNHATPAMRFTTANIIIGKSVGPAHWCSSPTMVGFYCTRQRKDIWPMWFSSEKIWGPGDESGPSAVSCLGFTACKSVLCWRAGGTASVRSRSLRNRPSLFRAETISVSHSARSDCVQLHVYSWEKAFVFLHSSKTSIHVCNIIELWRCVQC